MFTTAVVICYLWAFHPFEDGSHNTKEILNEVIVIIAAYPLLMCTAWVYDEELRIKVGWFIVACICGSMLFNIGSLLVVTTKKMIRSLKRRCQKRPAQPKPSLKTKLNIPV